MSLARGPSIDTQAHTAFPLRGFFKGLKSICVSKSAYNWHYSRAPSMDTEGCLLW